MQSRIPAFALSCLCSLSTAAASQPYSQSMMDCSALYLNAASFVASADKKARLLEQSDIWMEAAIRQSATEGRTDDATQICAKIEAKAEDWKAKGSGYFLSQDFRDWMAYCRAFAKDRGLPMTAKP